MSFVKKRNISENKKVLFHKIKIINNREHKCFQAISIVQTKKNFSLEKHLETSISEEVYKNIEDVINS